MHGKIASAVTRADHRNAFFFSSRRRHRRCDCDWSSGVCSSDLLLPDLGPIHIFHDAFPWHPLSFTQLHKLFVEPLPIAGPRNAIPSLHMAWVILAWWFSRGLDRKSVV